MQTVSTKAIAGAASPNQLPSVVSEIVSNNKPTDIDIAGTVARNAHKAVKGEHGGFKGGTNINNSRLFSAVCAEVKSKLGMESTARLDTEMAGKVQECIDNFRTNLLMAHFSKDEIVSHTWGPKHLASKNDIVVAHRLTAHRVIELRDKVFCCKLLINEQRTRLATLSAKFPSDHEYVVNCRKSVERHEATLAVLVAQQAQIAAGTKPAA